MVKGVPQTVGDSFFHNLSSYSESGLDFLWLSGCTSLCRSLLNMQPECINTAEGAAQKESKSAPRVTRVFSGRIEGCGYNHNHLLYLADLFSCASTTRGAPQRAKNSASTCARVFIRVFVIHSWMVERFQAALSSSKGVQLRGEPAAWTRLLS